MPSLGRFGFAWSLFAVAALAACASPRAGVPGATQEPSIASLEGTWEGEVWEMPVHYVQGVRRMTLKIARDGAWTASSGGTQCASGTVSVRGGLVILGGTRSGPDYCMPYSIEADEGRMRAVFETSFKSRQSSAMIGLRRSPEQPPQAAAAPIR